MSRKAMSQSGQAEVETAIVLPAVVFMILGLIQLGLLHQARLVAKYAAYRAVRTGSLRVYPEKDDWIMGMKKAGLAAALPVLSYSQGIAGGPEILSRTDSAPGWLQKWMRPGFGGSWPINRMIDLIGLIEYVEIRVCGPTQNDVRGWGYMANGVEYVSFDESWSTESNIAGQGITTKLRIQLTLNVRMIIPFADWAIFRMWRGWTITDELRLGEGPGWTFDLDLLKYDAAAEFASVHIIPIRVQYAMKMHSDIPIDHLPEHNHCL